MSDKTVAEHLVGYLEQRGVEHVFGLCGHTNIAVLAAMAESNIDFITVRHEQIAPTPPTATRGCRAGRRWYSATCRRG